MPAAYTNLYLEKGASFNTIITLDDVYGASYNLVGYTANSQFRKSYYSTNATATFATSIDTANATLTLSLTSAITSNVSPGRYVYDTTLTDKNGNVTRILEGVIDVSPSVTR
jgi:hypothetical protein